MKRRKRKTKPKFKMSYEYIPSPDAAVRRQRLCRRHEERLNRAYDMLFDKIEKLEEKIVLKKAVNNL